jgi:succinylglutamic semialdehyde dehydrogenase
MISLESILKNKPRFKGSFVDGQWRLPRLPHGNWEIVSPANFEWGLPPASFSFEDGNEAVAAAQRAFRGWKALSMGARIDLVRRFGEELNKRAEELGRIISVEVGKPYDEAKAEADLLLNKIQVTIEHALPLVSPQVVDLASSGIGELHWRPRGILVVIGPFNFPVHLSHGHIVPALLMGNVCILKPSERSPYSAQLYMEAAEAAGFPKGVLQLVQGNGLMASNLIRNSDIDGVLATCSYDIGSKIQKDLSDRPEKVIALEMGGKNAALVWEAGDIDGTAEALIRSAFLTTGQRCTGLSRVYVKRAQLKELVAAVHARAKELIISHPFDTDPKPFMGPLISAAAKERFLHYATIAEGEGAEIIMRPKSLGSSARQSRRPLPQGHYVTPSLTVVNGWDVKSTYQNHEIFGPDMFFCPVDSLEEGINAVNSSYYGLAFSFFGGDQKTFNHVADQIDCGLVYWNRPTVGASARLPFGGWKHSGNQRPAGIFAIYAAAQVQARIRGR